MGHIVSELKDTIFEMFEIAITDGRATESFKEDNKVLTAFTDFLSKAIVLSYYGLFDNDKNLKKLRRRAEEAETEGRGGRIDFMFGFKKIPDVAAVAVRNC